MILITDMYGSMNQVSSDSYRVYYRTSNGLLELQLHNFTHICNRFLLYYQLFIIRVRLRFRIWLLLTTLIVIVMVLAEQWVHICALVTYFDGLWCFTTLLSLIPAAVLPFFFISSLTSSWASVLPTSYFLLRRQKDATLVVFRSELHNGAPRKLSASSYLLFIMDVFLCS